MKRWLQVVLVLSLLVAQSLSSAAALLAAPPASRLAQDETEILTLITALKAAIPTPIHDPFRAESGWEVGEDESGGQRFYHAGAYHLAGSGDEVTGLSGIDVADFLVEVDAFAPADATNLAFGIVFRYVDADNGYFFGLVTNDGEIGYQLVRAVDGERELIATEALAAAFDPATAIALSVIAEKDTIIALVNGEVVARVTDDAIRQGGIGLLMSGEEEAMVSFDDFKLWRYEEMRDEKPTAEGGATDPQARLAAIRNTKPFFIDDFSKDENGWYTESEAGVEFAYVDETFGIGVTEPDLRAFSGNEEIYNIATDFLLEVDVQAVNEEVAEYGVAFRAQDTDNYFFFGLRGVDGYVVTKVVNGRTNDLIASTIDTTANGGTPIQRLALLLDGADYTFLVNDEVVATITDDTFSGGAWSLLVQSTTVGNVGATFDNLTLWDLPADEKEAAPAPEEPAFVIPDPDVVVEAVDAIYETDPIFSDEFRRDTGEWATVSEGGASAVRDRAYHLAITDENVFNHVTNQSIDAMTLGNYLVEVDTEFTAGSPVSNYGLVFRRVDNQNYYAFTLTGNQFRLARLSNNEWEILIDHTESAAVDESAGAINRLGVLAIDDEITLLINGVGVAQLTDATFAEGSVGLAAGTFDDGGVEVAFDNLDLWVIE